MRSLFFTRSGLDHLFSSLFQFVFLLLIFFLPTQFGKHFWPDFSFIAGIRIDYLSPTLFFTDILLALLLVGFFVHFFLSQKKRKVTASRLSMLRQHGVLVLSLLGVMLGVLLSSRPPLGMYGLLRLTEIVCFAFLTKRFLEHIPQGFLKIALVFSGALMFESTIGFLQFITQHSLGGLLYFVGERAISLQTPGAANASIGGSLLLRPYGTFSHPNVFSGYLFIGNMLLIHALPAVRKNWEKTLFVLALGCSSAILLLTLSRIALILYFVFILVFSVYLLAKKKARKGLKSYVISVMVFIALLSVALPFLLPRFQMAEIAGESLQERMLLMRVSLQMITEHLVFGLGAGQFLVSLPHYLGKTLSFPLLQPVHNIYLLFLAETGIAGGLLFFLFFQSAITNIKKKKSVFLLLLFLFTLLLGVADHYLLTLQQGRLLLGLVCGIVFSKAKSSLAAA
ncbi:MAG: O-antigen ligase family protein [Candidatus Levybacteria bacterium]|nr:O-antigen ligase family protein [Candidatus Levybacteria bacterium]